MFNLRREPVVNSNLVHCKDCRDDFYNDKNPYRITECWCLKTMKLKMRKEVPIDQVPPWTQEAKLIPHCYHREGYVYVGPKTTC
jgi:hypothetical protein